MKRSRLKQVSARRLNDGYSVWMHERLAREPRCALGLVITDPMHRCTVMAQGLHHLRKQGNAAGGARTCTANTLPACNACNQWVEMEPILAHELGLVVREGDARWAELGRRAHYHHEDDCGPR